MSNSSNSARSASPNSARIAEIAGQLTAKRPKVAIVCPVRIYADDDGADYWATFVAYSSNGSFSLTQVHLGHVKTEVPEVLASFFDTVIRQDRGGACSLDEAEAAVRTLVEQLKRRCKNVFACTTQTEASALAVKHFPGERSRKIHEGNLVESSRVGYEI